MQISSTNEDYYSIWNDYLNYSSSATTNSTSLSELTTESFSTSDDEEEEKLRIQKKKTLQEALEKQREEISDENLQESLHTQSLQQQAILSYFNQSTASETNTTANPTNSLQINSKSLQYAYGSSFAEKAFNL